MGGSESGSSEKLIQDLGISLISLLSLMNSSPKDIAKLQGAIENCDGASEKMAETMQDNLNGQITILKSQLQELAISIGDSLMPTVRGIVQKIQGFIDMLNHMDQGTRNMIIRIGLFIVALL